MNPTVAEVAHTLAQDPSSGVSAQGIITLALIVSAVLLVKYPPKKRPKRARPVVPQDPPQGASGLPPVPPYAPEGMPPDLAPFAIPEAPGPLPEADPTGRAPDPLREFVELGTPDGIPSVLAPRLSRGAWAQMIQSRRLSGLELDHTEVTPFGVDVHVRFDGATTFKYVQDNLRQLETGLDCPEDWKVQLKPGGSAASGIVRIVTHDPLGEHLWTPPEGPVRLRDPLCLSRTPFGEDVFISVKQRIGIFGTSGSGKSCTQRIVGAHVIQAIDADLEIWDLKHGVESQHYEGKAHRVTTVPGAVQRVEWLLKTEFPRRALLMRSERTSTWEETPESPARVIIIDEGNAIIRSLSRDQLKPLFQVIEQGRALGVYFVWSTQFPKADNLPTEIRSQLNCRISLLLLSSEESRVVFKDEVDAGWTPHLLLGPGWMMIRDTDHRTPDESKSPLLSEGAFRSVRLSGQAPDTERPLSGQMDPEPDSLSGQEARTVSDEIWEVLALSTEPLGVSELSRRTGRSKSAVHGALSRMEDDGSVCRTGTDTRPLFCLPLAG